VIALKYFAQDGTDPEEITWQQLAERLHKPAGTVRSDVSRAIQRMRKRLMEQRERGQDETKQSEWLML
jgi:hypothetical protein